MNTFRTELVVIQATPFCNINCRYCYLPDRSSTKRISFPTLSKIGERLFESQFVRKEVTIVWHAGEPLVLPIRFYEEAFAAIEEQNKNQVRIVWSIQTNGMLINNDWCDFFKRHHVRVGISLDGPEHVHDSNRVDRAGRGTYERVMNGIRTFIHAGLRPAIISVVTNASLPYPEEIWQLFTEIGAGHVGLNSEEVEGFNKNSSIFYQNAEMAYSEFIRRILTSMDATPNSPLFREYESAMRHIQSGENVTRSQDNVPMGILNFDWEGNFSTFSPELLTAKHAPYGDFLLGNVFDCSLEEVLQTEKFQNINAAIEKGVIRCRETCNYFMFCGGGSPSNKIAETGSFEATETRSCRLKIKATVDAILEHLEEKNIIAS